MLPVNGIENGWTTYNREWWSASLTKNVRRPLVASLRTALGTVLFIIYINNCFFIIYINNVDVGIKNLIRKYVDDAKMGNSVLTDEDRQSL